MPTRPIFLLVLAIAGFPSLAFGHAILEESTPPSGASVKPGPLELRFRYNSRIDHARSRLTLIRPDRSKDTIPIDAEAPPDIIDAHVDLAPGAYVIRWQVLAVDGHITRGDVPITVAAAAAPVTAPAAAAPVTAPAAAAPVTAPAP